VHGHELTSLSDMQEKAFHVAGVLVHALSSRVAAVGTRIAKLPGATVHGTSPDGKIVATLEAEDSAQILDQLTSIQRMQDVTSAALVSEHTEPLSAVNQEISNER
jgi:periplasmic nitrate reductase NapD